MYRLRISERALRDLDEAFDYLAHEAGEVIAARFRRETLMALRMVLRYPSVGRVVPESPGLRRFIAGRYAVYYRAQKSEIEIVRILQGAREMGDVFKEMR